MCVAKCSHPWLSVVVHCVQWEWSGASWAVEEVFQFRLLEFHSVRSILVEFGKLNLLCEF